MTPLSGPRPHRYHALDALRAAMMGLGLVLHTACAYGSRPLGPAWPPHDALHNGFAFDVLGGFIHSFRMPTFFAVAGFFAALLYSRRGGAGLAVNRVKRIAVPLVIFWAIVTPLVHAAAVYTAGFRPSPAVRWDRAWAFLAAGGWRPNKDLAHLWFLYYLLYYYAAALLLAAAADRGGRLTAAISAKLGRLLRGPWALPLLICLTAVTLYPMRFAGFDTPNGLVPHLRILIAYSVFFAFGWVLHAHPDLLARFARHAWAALALGVAAFAAHSVGFWGFAGGGFRPRGGGWHLLTVGGAAASAWLLLVAAAGLSVRYLDRPVAAIRYLTDASYWVYLIHLPIVMLMPALLYRWDAPAAAKFAVALGATVSITLATYHLMVRGTWLGALLEGRRSAASRAAPPVAPEIAPSKPAAASAA